MSDNESPPGLFFNTRWGIASVLIVVAVAVVSGVVLVGTLTKPDPVSTDGGSAATGTPSGASSSDALADDSASTCGLSEFSDAFHGTKPTTDWDLLDGSMVPNNPNVGPGLVEESGYRSCYARTADGALFAMANFAAMTLDRELAVRAARELTVPGPGQDHAVRQSESDRGRPPVKPLVMMAGFQVHNYTADVADISIAMRFDSEPLVSVRMQWAWHDGDWKLQVPDSGTLAAPTQLQSLGGYIPWTL